MYCLSVLSFLRSTCTLSLDIESYCPGLRCVQTKDGLRPSLALAADCSGVCTASLFLQCSNSDDVLVC